MRTGLPLGVEITRESEKRDRKGLTWLQKLPRPEVR